MMKKSTVIKLQTIKASVSMKELLKHYGLLDGLEIRANNLTGVCPFHKGSKRRAFYVDCSNDCWTCSCNGKQGGGVLEFVSRMEQISIQEAGLKITRWFGLGEACRSGMFRAARALAELRDLPDSSRHR